MTEVTLLGSEHALVRRAYQERLGSQGHSVDLQAMIVLVLDGTESVGWVSGVQRRPDGRLRD